MDSNPTREYKKLKITGPVSVERIDGIPESGSSLRILIMGPTGSGKSSFIQTLGLQGGERISSNQLEGFTQTVLAYKFNNVSNKDGDIIYLVDSPGFADTKISVMAIVSMIQKWVDDNRNAVFHRILYITPVTHVRISGSQRQVIKTFEALTGNRTADIITIVTSMWDSVWGESAKRAERTFNQLQNDIWKEFIGRGAQIVKFTNTQDSALQILDDALSTKDASLFFHMERTENPLQKSPFAVNIYNDLQDRITNLQTERATLISDLEYAGAPSDHLLYSVLQSRLEEADKYLLKFQNELHDFGPAPNPEADPQFQDLGNFSPTSSMLDLVTEITSESLMPPDVPPIANSAVETHSAAQNFLPLQHVGEPQMGRMSRALGLITRRGCCGNAVAKHHDI